ncbi:MAG: hypothetical protein FJ096_21510, partial [Deltaproteobacteria bacterium]|nr:hypothetical protein [Deltaproteobacteria bacterium]
DGNDCTEDLCNQGSPANQPRPLDAACNLAGSDLVKVCDGKGACVGCNQADACTHLPASDECQQRTCTAGKCGLSFSAVGTALGAASQILGDCKKAVCDGAGGTKELVDNDDLPSDANVCTKDVCTGGVPANPPEPVNTTCGAGGTLFCNGSGTCVGCTTDAQCAPDTFCQDNYCDVAIGSCKAKNKSDGTPLAAGEQLPGDCKERQCNGLGGIKTVSLNTDLPNDDNPCTKNVCANGTPSHPLEAINTACATMADPSAKVCNATGSCVECTSASTHCPAAPDCKAPSCSAAGKCGVVNDPDLAACDSQVAGDCKTKLCDGAGACTKTVNANDPASDGNACTSDSCLNGANVYTPVPNNQTVAGGCDQTTGCADPPCACDGSAMLPACKAGLGAKCGIGAQCASKHCFDGVCCNSKCIDGCAACSVFTGAQFDGICLASAITNDIDPGACDFTKGCQAPPCECNALGKCTGLSILDEK